MISQTNNTAIRVAYPSKTHEAKETKQNAQTTAQNESNRVGQLKESIGSGEYKVNLEATAQKMAESLL